MWGATLRWLFSHGQAATFQSTRPVWGATRWPTSRRRMRRDFNPRAPCGARPKRSFRLIVPPDNFNPRAPCGARRGQTDSTPCSSNFNPRAPCGARRDDFSTAYLRGDFNPRAPCGARHCRALAAKKLGIFQSTRPVWGATSRVLIVAIAVSISIHAPRVGRD